MPRTARARSLSGIYHVMIRGINRQDIFETDEDKMTFLSILRSIKVPEGKTPEERAGNSYTLYAYCLMSNHVHLLIKEEDEGISTIMQRLTCSYAPYFNHIYDRVGHLFQGRFESETCEDEKYFTTLIRYIHRNPIKADLVSLPEEYAWSSWREYLSGVAVLCDVNGAMDGIDRDWLVDYVNTENDDVCLDIDNVQVRIPDVDAKMIMMEICGVTTVAGFQRFEKREQRLFASQLKASGLSIRQIVRLTGMTIGIVRRL